MTDTRTPGQIAHETYWLTFAGRPPTLPWEQLIPDNRVAWEAAAQAVLAGTPRFQFALGSHVRRTGDAEHVWEIWWRSCREETSRTCIDYGLRLVDPASDYQPCRMSDGTDLTPAEEEP